jgi:hypothetical protein
MDWLQSGLDLVKDHWAKSLWLIPTAVPVLWGIYQARRQWKTREFMSRFSISLNMLRREGDHVVLWLPAAEEMQLEDVFHRNRTAVRIVRKAAYATTPQQPFLLTIPADDRRPILNEVANRVELMFREGAFALMAGLPVRYLTLIIGLTCEKGADVRIRKIRALVAEEQLLLHIERIEQTKLEKPHHVVRRQTLCRMARLYAEQPEVLGRITVALRVPEEMAARDEWTSAETFKESSGTPAPPSSESAPAAVPAGAEP